MSKADFLNVAVNGEAVGIIPKISGFVQKGSCLLVQSAYCLFGELINVI